MVETVDLVVLYSVVRFPCVVRFDVFWAVWSEFPTLYHINIAGRTHGVDLDRLLEFRLALCMFIGGAVSRYRTKGSGERAAASQRHSGYRQGLI